MKSCVQNVAKSAAKYLFVFDSCIKYLLTDSKYLIKVPGYDRKELLYIKDKSVLRLTFNSRIGHDVIGKRYNWRVSSGTINKPHGSKAFQSLRKFKNSFK